MRKLCIYLSKHRDVYYNKWNLSCIHDLESFDYAIELHRTRNKEIQDMIIDSSLYTTCLAALDFDYLGLFDKIVVYGKYKYAVFTFKKDSDNFIEYHIYNIKNDEEFIGENFREFRKAHNLYKLILSDYFKLNEYTD